MYYHPSEKNKEQNRTAPSKGRRCLAALLLPRILAVVLVAAPWILAGCYYPARALLWIFGAVIGEFWLGMLGWEERMACYTTFLGACGVLLGLTLPWLFVLLLIPFFFIECGTLLDEARAQKLSYQGESLVTKQTAPEFCQPEFYRGLAEDITDQGYLSVTWQDVAAVHARLQRGETLTSVVDQAIVWSLWRQDQINAPENSGH